MGWLKRWHTGVPRVYSVTVKQNGRIQSHSLELRIGMPNTREKVRKTIGWGPKDKCRTMIWNSALRWRDWCQALLPVLSPCAVRAVLATRKGTPTWCILRCLPLFPKRNLFQRIPSLMSLTQAYSQFCIVSHAVIYLEQTPGHPFF